VDTSPDQQLIVRAKQGDLDAFGAILAPALEKAYRYACAILHDASLAEDVVQEACVRAWQKLGRLHAGSPFEPWFLGIVNKQCREQMRGRWWHLMRIPGFELAATELPEEAALRRATLREALGELTERERQVLILRLYLDLSWTEVAAVTGLTEAGARTRYYRALDRFRFSRGSQEVMT
jgi:RNA polymerase sigma-70 factor (ECF subfamily)